MLLYVDPKVNVILPKAEKLFEYLNMIFMIMPGFFVYSKFSNSLHGEKIRFWVQFWILLEGRNKKTKTQQKNENEIEHCTLYYCTAGGSPWINNEGEKIPIKNTAKFGLGFVMPPTNKDSYFSLHNNSSTPFFICSLKRAVAT